MTKSDENAVVVEDLTKRYKDVTAVDRISFTIRKGEVFAFLGPNGAGKTSTVEVIETIRKPTSGTVHVLGMDVAKQKRDIVRRIGVLPQAFNSFDRLTVRESLRYYARLFDRGYADVDGLIELTDLVDKRDAQFKTLSGGLKQRLGIAIALVNDPEIVFLDEPTTGLDPRARRDLWLILLNLKQKGKTVFLTTHYIEEAELLADTVAIISKGQIVAMAPPHDLIECNANYMNVTLKNVDAKAFEMIRGMRFDPVQDGRNIRFHVKHADDVCQLLTTVRGAGLSIPGLDVRKPNLEEVYLQLTGETLGKVPQVDGESA